MATKFYGGTDLAMAAYSLADHYDVGEWLRPAEAIFDKKDDADAFEQLLIERGIKFSKEPRP